jgi:hypothetical protein
MPVKYILPVILAALTMPLFGQARSFAVLFPDLDESAKAEVFSPNGLLNETEKSGETPPVPRLFPPFLSGTGIIDSIMPQNSSFLVESLMVIPLSGYSEGLTGIYNAFSRIGDLQGRRYHSATRDRDVPLFEDATRIEGPKKLSPIPDAPPVRMMPPETTIFIRLKDINFGNSYYRADIKSNQWGLTFSLSNFRNITYFLIPVIKENKFNAHLYIEPITEGILIYSIAGADISDFISSRIHMPSAIQKRLAVIMEWVIDGIHKTS